ncbi:MAG: 2'-5' RNA ligase family protein [Proteobacteria bacterium]|nr:2'-5' RNA ligase family protein [Pseudomonadota bacterium]
MHQRYNLALIPTNSLQFVQYSDSLSQIAPTDTYQLGQDSLPHVTLCQFEMPSNQIDAIWDKVKALELASIELHFAIKRSKIYEHAKWGGVCWVSLISNELNKLKEMHLDITQIIKNPINAAFNDYDPHLTLFNSNYEEAYAHLNLEPEVNPPLRDEFRIALGLLDNVGQITEILES